MRKFLISLAAAAAGVAVAAPASAQFYGAPAYGYAAPYAVSYGYGGTARWSSALRQIRYQMSNLAAQGRLTPREARDLRRDIRATERSLRYIGYRGVSPWEAQAMDQRIARLHYELARYSDYDRRARYGYRWR